MQVNMLEAKNRLSTLIVAAERDEEVVIARNGVPVAKIVKYIAPKVAAPGIWNGLSAYTTNWTSIFILKIYEITANIFFK